MKQLKPMPSDKTIHFTESEFFLDGGGTTQTVQPGDNANQKDKKSAIKQ
jgi:hypothetical protein